MSETEDGSKFEVRGFRNFEPRTSNHTSRESRSSRLSRAIPHGLVVHMYESLVLVLLCQGGEVAVDLVMVATVGPHLNRHVLDA